jgi:hypothetical protein
MENNQQQIIDSLIAEFNRINSMSANNKKFNLINKDGYLVMVISMLSMSMMHGESHLITDMNQ